MTRFEKPFTQQEPIPEAGIAAAVEVMRSGRLHRYNTGPGEESAAAAFERDYAAYQGARFCVACASGGYALALALRAMGIGPGDRVLANAWTLAPVPGAIAAVGAEAVLVEIGRDWRTDLEDLAEKAAGAGAKAMILSHMRGHIGEMEAVAEICTRDGIALIEDCAHTMGARWKGVMSGNFGRAAAFSTQTYKHMNSGEGGVLTTDDPELAARAILLTGSYMLYDRHGARPDAEAFDALRLETPNQSGRMDNLRAAILRAQLPHLEENIRRWNARYAVLEAGLAAAPGLSTIARPQHEAYVGSSIQFHADGLSPGAIPDFLAACAARGVEIKWFGADLPQGFTSRFDHWRYLGPPPDLPKTRAALATTCDMRVPLTFDEADCRLIGAIIAEEAARFAA